MSKLRIEVVNRQSRVRCGSRALKSVLKSALAGAAGGVELSVAVVSDEEMRELNRRFLGRDRPTDVMAFPYGMEGGRLEGEIVVNADEACRRARDTSHSAQDELMLYVVHGLLHLLGHDDAEPDARRRMHERAIEVLRAAGRKIDAETLLED